MLNCVVGKKIGMSQVFSQDRNVLPVSIVKIGRLVVTQCKRQDSDGYEAFQIGLVRERLKDQPFHPHWLKEKKKYFERLFEVCCDDEKMAQSYKPGQNLALSDFHFVEGSFVSVRGKSRGKGFQGVVKRHGFGGGRKTHGSDFHRAPGAIGSMRRQGVVIKGKKLPGHMGNRTITTSGLLVVRIDDTNGVLYIKGAVPGAKHSLVSIFSGNG